MMRVKVLWLVLVAWLAVPLLARADKRDVTFVNRTGKEIDSLYISPVGVDHWEDDVLGGDVLGDGQTLVVEFEGYSDGECAFDILAASEDGDAWLLPGVDLCMVGEIVITAKDKTAKDKDPE
jgi:hypothetical protein